MRLLRFCHNSARILLGFWYGSAMILRWVCYDFDTNLIGVCNQPLIPTPDCGSQVIFGTFKVEILNCWILKFQDSRFTESWILKIQDSRFKIWRFQDFLNRTDFNLETSASRFQGWNLEILNSWILNFQDSRFTESWILNLEDSRFEDLKIRTDFNLEASASRF